MMTTHRTSLASVLLLASFLTAGLGDITYDYNYDSSPQTDNQYQRLQKQGYSDYNFGDDEGLYPSNFYDNTDQDDGDMRDYVDEKGYDDTEGYNKHSSQYEGDDEFQEKDTQLRSNDPRDPEKMQQSSLWGTHYVSGGAGEGKQHLKPNGEEDNKQEVKSDAGLPAYCEPPNPCPKGFTEDQNCRKTVKDTADFNRKYILSQQDSRYCACDSEHMKHCPRNQPKIDTKQDASANLKEILAEENLGKNPFVKGNKRNKLVAKKRPAKRSKRNVHVKGNPYLSGEKLNIAAKKSPPDFPFKKWDHFNKMMESSIY